MYYKIVTLGEDPNKPETVFEGERLGEYLATVAYKGVEIPYISSLIVYDKKGGVELSIEAIDH